MKSSIFFFFWCGSETGKHLASSIFKLRICPLPRHNAVLLLPFSLQAGRGGTNTRHPRGIFCCVCVCGSFCGCACAAISPALLAFLLAPLPSQGGREGGSGGVVASGKDSGEEFASAHSSSPPQEVFLFFSPQVTSFEELEVAEHPGRGGLLGNEQHAEPDANRADGHEDRPDEGVLAAEPRGGGEDERLGAWRAAGKAEGGDPKRFSFL